MRYRGLTWNDALEKHEWIYGMPSYGYGTGEITQIETIEAVAGTHFHNIIPESLGEETEYTDKHGKQMYTGDIATLLVDGEVREFTVERATVDREYNTLPGFDGETVKVRLAGVVVFRWMAPDGITHQLLPCVNEKGIADPYRMEIIGTVVERAVREGESESQKQ